MNKATDFTLQKGRKMVKVADLITALNGHCKPVLDGESFCCPSLWNNDTKDNLLPKKFRWLVAYAVKGESEGWYVHVGVIQPQKTGRVRYEDFGHAKVWSEETSFAVAKAAQQFLTSAMWN
jgi:hypothetical protein